jgi:hypothetical protein
LTTSILGTELGAFVIASLAGYAGTPILGQLVTKKSAGTTD